MRFVPRLPRALIALAGVSSPLRRRSGRKPVRESAPAIALVTGVIALLALSGSAALGGTRAAAASSTIRINAGGRAVTDAAGQVWAADEFFVGGGAGTHAIPIAGAADQALYQTERWGMSAYRIPVPSSGVYTVRLRFAETRFTKPGSRIFSVTAQGVTVVSNLDLVAVAGAATAYDVSVPVNVTNGVLTLGFSATVNQSKVSAIEVDGTVNMPLSTPTPTATAVATATATASATATPTATATASPSPTPLAVGLPALTRQLSDMVDQSLDSTNRLGWNSAQNGPFVNWYIANPSSQQNTGFDEGTALRNYDALLLRQARMGKGQNPVMDGYLDRERAAGLTTFLAKPYDKSWAIWTYIDAGTYDNPAYLNLAHQQATYWLKQIDPTVGVDHGPGVTSTGATATSFADGYRVDAELQKAAGMVWVGYTFNDQPLITAGLRELDVVHAQGFVAKTGMYARLVEFNAGVPFIADYQHKAGEQGQNVWALARASELGGPALLTMARELMTGLENSPLHDTVNGGFFFVEFGDTGAVTKTYKEQARAVTIAIAAKLLGDDKLRAEMIQTAVKAFVSPPVAGWSYRVTPTFGLYGNPPEAWVTSEAIGINVLAIEHAGS